MSERSQWPRLVSAPMADLEIICAGMTVVDVLAAGLERMPAMGETGMASGITLALGGDATNQSVALAKLGNAVGLMTLIGDDAQGNFICEQCRARNISTEGLYVSSTTPTTTTIVLIDKSGEHVFLGARAGSAMAMGLEHFNLDLIKPGLKVFSIGSLYWAPRFDHEAVLPLLRKAKSIGAVTIADMVMDYIKDGLDGSLRDAWQYLDYAAPSELEAELLTGTKDPVSIARAFRNRGVKNVILKRGRAGIMAFIGNSIYECPAFNVPAIDTTGAGDNFLAGFMHCLVRGMEPGKAIRFASACAALSIQEVGAGTGLKHLQQVEDFLKSQGMS
jgi:sugar/nucleoside kinase (ribokinase family)